MTPETLTNIIRLAFGAAAAVVTFLLVQTDVPLDPVVKVILGAINVALAAIGPAQVAGRLSSPTEE